MLLYIMCAASFLTCYTSSRRVALLSIRPKTRPREGKKKLSFLKEWEGESPACRICGSPVAPKVTAGGPKRPCLQLTNESLKIMACLCKGILLSNKKRIITDIHSSI